MSTLKDIGQDLAKAAVKRTLGGDDDDAPEDPEKAAVNRRRKLLAIAVLSGLGLVVGAAVLMKIWWYLVFGAGAVGLLGAGYLYYKPKITGAIEEKKAERAQLEAKKTAVVKEQSAQEKFDDEFARLKALAAQDEDA